MKQITKEELIKKAKRVHFEDKIPPLGGIYIIQTDELHDSGFKIMLVIGHTKIESAKDKMKYYLIDIGADVIDWMEFYTGEAIKDLHMDINEHGVIHIWSNTQTMKNIFRLSNCVFGMNREK